MSHIYYAQGIVWAVLVPLVFLGLLLAFLVLYSYNHVYRSVDVLLLGLLSALALDVAGLVLVQGVLYIRDEGWGRRSCQVYAWAWLWLRLTKLLLLVGLSLERVLLLHARRYKHRGSTGVKLLVIFCWCGAAVIAAIPIIGWDDLDLAGEVPILCRYMVYEIDHHYAIFVVVLEIATAFLALGCLADTFLHLRHIAKETKPLPEGLTLANGGLGQVGLPTAADLWNMGSNFTAAYDSCRLVCIILAVTFVVNHIPHALISLYVILTSRPLEDFRVAAQWLLLVEAAILPTCLWLFNWRYREGLRHFMQALCCMGPYFYPGRDERIHQFHSSYLKHLEGGNLAAGSTGGGLQGEDDIHIVTVPVPVQQVITRSRLSDLNSKSNPGFESDDEDTDGRNILDGRSRGRRRTTQVVTEHVVAEHESNNSDRSWVLVDGYLMRTKSQEDEEPQPSTSNEQQSTCPSGEAVSSNGVEEPTAGPSHHQMYSASSTIPLSHRFPTPDSDSSCSDDESSRRHHTVFYAYGQETHAEVLHSDTLIHKENTLTKRKENKTLIDKENTLIKGHENKDFKTDALMNGQGNKAYVSSEPESAIDDTEVKKLDNSSSVYVTTSDTSVSGGVISDRDMRGTPSPDSASHLPYFLKQPLQVQTETEYKAAVEPSSSQDEVDSVGGSYSDDDIDHVLKSSDVESLKQGAGGKEIGSDQNKTDAKKLADMQMSSYLPHSSRRSSVGSTEAGSGSVEDLNIVSYMDVRPETVQDVSSEGSEVLTESPTGDKVRAAELRSIRSFGLNTVSHSNSEPQTLSHNAESNHQQSDLSSDVRIVHLATDTRQSATDTRHSTHVTQSAHQTSESSVYHQSKTQVVIPMQTSDAFHTENPLASASLERQQSEVHEPPILKSVRKTSSGTGSVVIESADTSDDARESGGISTISPRKIHAGVRANHSNVMRELVNTTSSTTSYSYSLTFPRNQGSEEIAEQESQTLPKTAAGHQLVTPDVTSSVVKQVDRESHDSLRKLLHQELNLRFSADAYLEPLVPSKHTKEIQSGGAIRAENRIISHDGAQLIGTRTVSAGGAQFAETRTLSAGEAQFVEPEPLPELRHVPVKEHTEAPEPAIFIEPLPALKHVPPHKPEHQLEVLVHPSGLYSDNGYRHMEQDLLGRGRGRVIGTFPSAQHTDDIIIPATSRLSPDHTTLQL